MTLFLESISFGEIIIIFLFILIFFGADSIPGLARNLGRGIRQIKNASQDIQDEIIKSSTEIKREMNVNRALYEDAQKNIEQPIKEIAENVEETAKEIKIEADKE